MMTIAKSRTIAASAALAVVLAGVGAAQAKKSRRECRKDCVTVSQTAKKACDRKSGKAKDACVKDADAQLAKCKDACRK